MRRLIDAVTGKKNVLVLGHRQDRRVVVTGRPMKSLRTLLAARSNLARLALRLGTELLALRHRRAVPVTLGAAGATRPCRLRAWRFGLCQRGPGYPRGGRS